VIFAHLRLRRRVSLLAAGLLEGRERAEVLSHLAGCASCRADHDAEAAALRAVVAALASDPLRTAEPHVPAAVLASRVARAVDEARVPSGRRRFWLAALPAMAALVALAVAVPPLLKRSRPEPVAARVTIPPAEASVLLSEDALARIERNLAREQAARYLNEAGEVLVTVAATGVDCDRTDDRLDVGEAPERSRELLEKRRLVVDEGGDAVESARGVLDDVELALRQVAELPSCVKRRDVELVQKDVEARQLLMRIRLMTRELEG
jgi:Putative zinc-finger